MNNLSYFLWVDPTLRPQKLIQEATQVSWCYLKAKSWSCTCLLKKIIISLMYQLPAFKGAPLQKGYSIGGIFKGLTRMFTSVGKKGLSNLGKQALQSGAQVLDDVSWGKDMKAAIKRHVKLCINVVAKFIFSSFTLYVEAFCEGCAVAFLSSFALLNLLNSFVCNWEFSSTEIPTQFETVQTFLSLFYGWWNSVH